MKYISNHVGAGGFPQIRQTLSQKENKTLMKEAYDNLRKRNQKRPIQFNHENPNTLVPLHRIRPWTKRLVELEKLLGAKPKDWIKPSYGSIDYHLAYQQGWISKEEKDRDEKLYEERRKRSLDKCHRYSQKWFKLSDEPYIPSGGSFIPEISAAILDDPDLSDGARRFAFKLMEVTYKQNREGRAFETTVSYLAKMLGRHARTIQNYLAILEYKTYINTQVVFSKLTKMSVGLVISLGKPLFPKHYKEKWPEKCRNSGTQLSSFKIVHINNTELIPRNLWALKCMEGIFRVLMASNSILSPPVI